MKKGGHKGAVEDNESDSENDELDVEKELYGADSDEEDEDNAEENWKYEDFFGAKAKKSKRRVEEDSDDDMNMEIVDDYQDSDAEEDASENGEEEEEDGSDISDDDSIETSSDDEGEESKPAAAKTPFEQRQERLRAQIAALEEEMLQEKRWDMRGEIRSSQRPENSLLDIVADVERYPRSIAFDDNLFVCEERPNLLP